MNRSTLLALGLATTLGGYAGAASAHATLEQTEARVGAGTKITLRVPHGCDGEATNTVRITIPDGFYAVKPMPKAGWTLTTTIGAYDHPYMNHGTEMTEGVREVVWSGGDLQDDWYDEFTLRGTVGPNVEAGQMMFFPAVQECAHGQVDWTDTSGSHDVPNPAPKLMLVADQAPAMGHDHGSHDHGAMPMAMEEVHLGDLVLSGGFSRATLPNAPVAGGFLTITNTGSTDDRLLSAESDIAGETQVHEMSVDKGVMKMRQLSDGLPIPAGQTVDLKPGGFHIMFMDLHQPLVEGETVKVRLVFEKAGETEVTLKIGAPNAKSAEGHMNH